MFRTFLNSVLIARAGLAHPWKLSKEGDSDKLSDGLVEQLVATSEHDVKRDAVSETQHLGPAVPVACRHPSAGAARALAIRRGCKNFCIKAERPN